MTRRGLIIGLAATTALAACSPTAPNYPGQVTAAFREIQDLVYAFAKLENDFASIKGLTLGVHYIKDAIEQMQVAIIYVTETVTEMSQLSAENILVQVQDVLNQVASVAVNTPVSTLVSAAITLIPIIAQAYGIATPPVPPEIAAYLAHYPHYTQERADQVVASLAHSGGPVR